MSEAETITPLVEVLSTEESLYEKYTGRRGRPSEGKGFSGMGANNAFKPDEHNNTVLNGLDLHNAASPQFHIKKESTEHRFLIYLFAQGHSTKEVFLQLGGQWDNELGRPIPGTGQFSYAWLTQIRKQAWFRERLTNFLHDAGKDVIAAKIETEVVPSIEVVISLRDDVSVPPNVRLNAANTLIERHLGKPIQQIKTESVKTVQTFEKSAEDLQRELDQIETELRNCNAAL